MKKIIIAVLLLHTAAAFAQTYDADALRISQPTISSTARSMGVAGAFSSVGADPSSFALNPAGLAIYRSHEFAGTLSYQTVSSQTNYLGNNITTNDEKISLPHISLILASKSLRKTTKPTMSFTGGSSKLERIVFGISYNKSGDFSRTDIFSGSNNYNTLAGAFVRDLAPVLQNGQAISLNNSSLPSFLAWQTYVVDTLGSGNGTIYPLYFNPAKQKGRITTDGSMSDVNIALGFNIADWMYVGLGANIPIVNYQRSYTFTEANTRDSLYFPDNYTLDYNYKMSGIGFNGKLGVIAKPRPWLRLGAALHTPSWLNMEESNSGSIQNNFDSLYALVDTFGYYRYRFHTPLRFTAGASFYLKQWGFVSIDYELNDYASMRYRPNDVFFSKQNTIIKSKYRVASSLRVGAELAWKVLRARVGFQWAQSPFSSGVGVKSYDNSRLTYTAGLGYRGKYFYTDFAYALSTYKDYFAPYTETANEPGVFTSVKNHLFLLTFGFRFGMSVN